MIGTDVLGTLTLIKINTHPQIIWFHSCQCSTNSLAQSAKFRTPPRLANRVIALPTMPIQVRTLYLNVLVICQKLDGVTVGFASCPTTAALIKLIDPTFSVCISPNGSGISAYATSGVFTGISFPSRLAVPASARTQSDRMLFGVQIAITALANASCFMISSR